MADAVAAGATVIFASHELDRATAVAHRTVSVVGGTVADEPRAVAPAADHPLGAAGVA
jgi:ABC-type polar amino acid transport system ATPase subunit